MIDSKQSENLETQLRSFQQEIGEIALEEAKTKRTSHFTDLQDKNFKFNPQDLTLVDLDMWQRIKDGTITREDLRMYDMVFYKLIDNKTEFTDVPKSRRIFQDYITNKATEIIVRREIEKTENKK